MAAIPSKRRRGSYKQYLNSKIQVPRNTVKRWKCGINHLPSSESPPDQPNASCTENSRAECSSQHHNNLQSEIVNANENSIGENSGSASDAQSYSIFDLSDDDSNLEESTETDLEPLYDGSPVSTDLAVMAILQYYVNNNLSKQGLNNLLQLLDTLLPSPHNLPKSKYHLEKLVNKFAPPVQHLRHEYCMNCNFYIGHSDSEENLDAPKSDMFNCPICSSPSKKGFFITFNLHELLKNFLENGEASRHIIPKNNLRDGAHMTSSINDVTDGYCYSDLKRRLKMESTDLTLIWNTDGVPVFKSSQAQLWPIQFSIAEISPKIRQNFILVCGLWFGHQKPDMNTFLRPFAKDLASLATDGVRWYSAQLRKHLTSRVIAPLSSLDAVAKASVMNVHQFNGEFGCPVCEIQGTVINHGNGHSRIYENDGVDDPALRTNAGFIEQAREAVESGVVVKGVKGPSILSILFYFNLAWAFPPDYMHCVLLGVVRQCLFLWFDSTHHNKPWSMSTRIKVIDEKLCAIKPTSELNRLPRSIRTRKYWKASELRSWLLFYSIPVVHKILPSKFFNHWLILVFSIFTLLKDSVTTSEIDLCKAMLNVFCLEMGVLYGREQLTFNVHQLLHLPLAVKRWGPLWASSAFRFEGNNGVLLSLIHGTQQVNMQLVNTLKLINAYNVLRSKFSKNLDQCLSIVPLGNPVNILVPELEKLKISMLFPCPYNMLKFFSRCKKDGILLTSKLYKVTNRCNNAVKYNITNNIISHYGFIKYFVQAELSGPIACVIERHEVVANNLFKNRECNIVIKHLIPLSSESSAIDVVPLVQVKQKMLSVSEGFFSYFPNHYEFNL